MPFTETAIMGYDWEQGHHNQNIVFEDTEELKYKEYKNKLMWSEINGINFPKLWEKKFKEPISGLITAPSFLQFEYENTIIAFTRNSVSRFILKGTPDGWASQTDNLIEEYNQYGLLAKESLGKLGDALFWFSEVGAIRWDKDGIKLISKDRIDIPVSEDIIGFAVPLRNQYWFYQPTEQIMYVYHKDNDCWTTYSGIEVNQSQTLSAGANIDNVNLLLFRTKTDSDIYLYPDEDNYTDEIVYIEKPVQVNNKKLFRTRFDYDGDLTLESSVENRFEETNQTYSTISRMNWVNFDNGIWGEQVTYTITGMDKLIKIELDTIERS